MILSAGDCICVFVLFVGWMGHPAQGAAGGRVMPALVFTWVPLCGSSLFDALEG